MLLVDALAEAVAAIVQLAALVIELLIRAVIVATRWSISLLYIDSEDGRRFSMRGLLLAPIPIVLLLGLGRAGYLYLTQGQRLRAKIEATQQEVDKHAKQLATILDDSGRLARDQSGDLAAIDVWGNPLRVTYRESTLSDTVTVVSIGPDEAPNTSDDIASSQSVLRPKREIGLGLLGKAMEKFKNRNNDANSEEQPENTQ